MFNVINNGLKFIKHIQNNFFSGVDVIMIANFYETSPIKDSWIFQSIKDNVHALTLHIWQIHVICYEINKAMQQFNVVFIQTLNKFCMVIKNTKDIKFIKSICNDNHPTILLFCIYFI
jgi:response regulator of citrate/malate metabolism